MSHLTFIILSSDFCFRFLRLRLHWKGAFKSLIILLFPLMSQDDRDTVQADYKPPRTVPPETAAMALGRADRPLNSSMTNSN